MTQDAMVKNAADEGQVQSAVKKERLSRDQELDDIKWLLSERSGRRFLWRMLNRCRVFESVYHQSSLVYYNSGQQDIGHFILSEITTAHPDALVTMMQENREDGNG